MWKYVNIWYMMWCQLTLVARMYMRGCRCDCLECRQIMLHVRCAGLPSIAVEHSERENVILQIVIYIFCALNVFAYRYRYMCVGMCAQYYARTKKFLPLIIIGRAALWRAITYKNHLRNTRALYATYKLNTIYYTI